MSQIIIGILSQTFPEYSIYSFVLVFTLVVTETLEERSKKGKQGYSVM
jgi:hypothetical protein